MMLLARKTSVVDVWLEYNEPVFELLRNGATSVPVEDGVFLVLTNVDTHARTQNQTADELFDEIVSLVGDLGVAKLKLVNGGWDCSPRIMMTRK